tara:strand:+ start:6361 stop:6954 length:594 start_codon:yes stop_codon:yes gene_type:complete
LPWFKNEIKKMKEDSIDNIFEKLNSQFDFENPNLGHQERFLEKLKNQNLNMVENNSGKYKFWKPLMAIAASVILCFSLLAILQQNKDRNDLASVSPKMAETQDFFIASISEELLKLNEAKSPETEAIINDAMKQLQILEKEYETLKDNLFESGDDKRVIYAMISNFQTRIDVLKNVMETIENVKQLKQHNNENPITI